MTDGSEPPVGRAKKFLRWLRLLLPCVAIGFFLHAIGQVIGRLDWAATLAQAQVGWLVISLVLLVIVLYAQALGWVLIVRGLGGRLPIAVGCAIWFKASVVRYVPGVIWSFASRAALASRLGIGGAVIGASLTAEQLLLFACAALAGLLGVFHVGMPLVVRLAIVGIAALPVVWLVITAANIFTPLSTSKAIPRWLTWLGLLIGVPASWLARLIAYYVATWILFAALFAGLSSALLGIDNSSVLFAVACYWLFAVSLSALLPLLPAGLGVREGVLFFLLIGTLSQEHALVLALSSRLWLMGAEAVAVTLAFNIRQPQGDVPGVA